MPRNVRLGFILSFLLICQPAARLSDNQPAITPTRPIVLFDGKDLKHFYTYLQSSKYSDPKGVFRISNGELRISGEEWGALTTRDRFRDYHLLVEWRWGGATFEPRKNSARDSGILIHGSGPDGAAFGCWLESIEAQIIEGGTGDIILVGGQNRPALSSEIRTEPGSSEVYWQPGGTKIRRDQGRYNWYGRDPAWKDVLGYRGPHDVEKPVGEWNRLEVICDGAQIINVLNGVVVNHGTDATHTEGKIQIQSEGAEIIIRRVELRPVDRTLVTSLLTRAREMGRGKPQGARLNKVIELLQVGQPALGIFVSNISTRGAAGLASSKLDFVIIDMEHSPFDASRLEAYLLAMTDKRRILEKQSLQPEVVPIVRLPANAREQIQFLTKQVLDLGAYGIVIPHVETREEAEAAARAARYPQPKGAPDALPRGQRGVGYGWAARYWGIPAAQYPIKADLWPLDPDGELLLWCMIESAKGVENCRAIAATPGVSGILVGPSDLAVSLGVGTENDPAVNEAMKKVLNACLESGIPCGTVASGQGVTERLSEGFRFLAVGSDGGISAAVERSLELGRKPGRIPKQNERN